MNYVTNLTPKQFFNETFKLEPLEDSQYAAKKYIVKQHLKKRITYTQYNI